MVVEADALRGVRLATLREQAITTGHQTTLARAALNDAMGRPLEEAWDIRDRLEVVAAAVDEPADLPPRVSGGRTTDGPFRGGGREREVRAARAAFLPSLNALGSWELNTADFASNGQGSWFVGLRPVEFFNGSPTARGSRKPRPDSTAAPPGAHGECHRSEVKEAALGCARPRSGSGARGAVDQAEASLGLVQQRYGAGLTTIVDLLATEAALTQARGNLSRALHDHRVGQMRLELALGTLAKDTLR
jgi:outer membrane protein TolC